MEINKLSLNISVLISLVSLPSLITPCDKEEVVTLPKKITVSQFSGE